MQPGPGANFDVGAVNTAELQRYIQLNAVQPLQLKNLPGRQRQLPRFQALEGIPGLVHGGRSYAIPYAWSEMGLIYHPDHFATPPASIAALWDPRLQGRVLAYDGGTHAFSLAAQKLGLPSPFRIPAAKWPMLVESLVALRRNVSGFYTLPEESLDLYRRRGAWLMLANYGRQQFQLLRQAGLDVRYALPREGALAWLDCWAVTRQARDPDLAHAWINHMLSPAASEALRQRQGLGATTNDGDAPALTAPLVWLEPVEDDDRRNRLWRRIVSGDSVAKVLRS
jgi:putative spermidine/putrescine transport system substrate-binding protein